MHCGKLLRQRLSAWHFDRQVAKFQVAKFQVAEFQVFVAVVNGLAALGTPITEGRGIGLSGEWARLVRTTAPRPTCWICPPAKMRVKLVKGRGRAVWACGSVT